MSINIKKKSKLYKILDQNNLLDILVFGFLMNEYVTLIRVDRTIHGIIVGKMEKYTDKIMNKFIKVYKDYLTLNRLTHGHKLRPYHSSKNELKIDFPIYFHVNPVLKSESVYSLSYSCELVKKDKVKKYLWKTQFLLTMKSSRSLWMYKEQSQENQDLPVYTIDIVPVSVRDLLCITVPFYNMGRRVQADAVTFYPLESQKNASSSCPIQSLYPWQPYDYYKNPIDFEVQDIIRCFPQKLECIDIKKSEIDSHYRIQLKCNGEFEGNILNHSIKCHNLQGPMIIDMKKKGYYDQKNKKMLVRIGDFVVIYLMKK